MLKRLSIVALAVLFAYSCAEESELEKNNLKNEHADNIHSNSEQKNEAQMDKNTKEIKKSELIDSMTRVESMMRKYSTFHNGSYPLTVKALFIDSTNGAGAKKHEIMYFDSIKNVVTNKIWNKDNPEGLGVLSINEDNCSPGLIKIEVLKMQEKPLRYRIQACNEKGELFTEPDLIFTDQ